MRATLILYIMAFAATVLLQACSESKTAQRQPEDALTPQRITPATAEAADPYFTRDHQGNPVLCWTEKVSEEKGYLLKFAVFDTLSRRFGHAVEVATSLGTRAHAESMNKIAFKADGTIVAVFAVRHADQENPFAGSVLYTLSDDQGKTWSAATPLHSDTLKTYGRSFFDLHRLPGGEVGAVWLDGRFGDKDTGSALFFASTLPGKGFGQDRQIGESTCECCRTDLYVDDKNFIHVAYRDILLSSAGVGEQVRDIVHMVSRDSGQSFSQARRISADNWAVDGCPHTGPSLAADSQGLHAVWFTAEGQPGVYHAFSSDGGHTFTERQLLSRHARHPQMVSLPGQGRVVVWQELQEDTEKLLAGNPVAGNPVAGKPVAGHQHRQATTPTVVMLQQLHQQQKAGQAIQVSEKGQQATYPVVIPLTSRQVLVAWVQQDQGHATVYYAVISNF